jgi:hypothetical protein
MFRLWEIRNSAKSEVRIVFGEENSVTTLQAVILGMLLSWTPCVVLMAYLLWRAPPELDEISCKRD